MYEQNVLYKSFKHTFNHALLESKISGTISFVQCGGWWVLDLTSETLLLQPHFLKHDQDVHAWSYCSCVGAG